MEKKEGYKFDLKHTQKHIQNQALNFEKLLNTNFPKFVRQDLSENKWKC